MSTLASVALLLAVSLAVIVLVRLYEYHRVRINLRDHEWYITSAVASANQRGDESIRFLAGKIVEAMKDRERRSAIEEAATELLSLHIPANSDKAVRALNLASLNPIFKPR